MVELLLGAQVLALFGMVAVSLWGWKHISPETRIRARTGTTGLDYTMSKKTALVFPPLIGSLVVIGTFALRDSPNSDTVASLGLAIIVIYLLAHWSSTKRAAR
jgi:hypothetical protein